MRPLDRFADKPAASVVIFTSPKAGSGGQREQIPRLVELIQAAGQQVTVVDAVASLQHAVRQASGAAVVVAAGGDGTLALAVQSLPPDVPLVPMPMGTENLLARHFGHTARAPHVIDTIRHGQPRRLDAGLANGRPFLIMASCGFDAEVVRGMHLTRGGHISRFSYAGPIWRAMRRYRFPTVRVEMSSEASIAGQSRECRDRSLNVAWCMVFNLPSYAAGLEIEPAAVGTDGQLDLIAFRHGSILSGLKYLVAVATGTHQRLSDVDRRRGSRFRLTSTERVPYQLDGDYVGRLPVEIETLPERVTLLLPTTRP